MKKPYRDASTTVPSATDSTTREVDHAWLEKANSYAKNVIDAETKSLKPKSWKERQSLHEAVANGIVKLFNDSAKNKGYRYEALAYLPYADNERHAFIKLPDNIDVVRNEYASVNYAVARQLSDGSKVTDQWASIGKNASDILEATLSLTALRCGYEFVWYQLGYRYFPAGYATGNYTLFTEGANKYSEKCGQIFFFP
ncbi:hypothetical protein AAVH_08153 [Aphelenchoides avenae]|nr:hypothetical protein AAVH_08153 [Aphelenchus avenae]